MSADPRVRHLVDQLLNSDATPPQLTSVVAAGGTRWSAAVSSPATQIAGSTPAQRLAGRMWIS